MANKLTYEHVKNKVESMKGHKLLSETYENSKSEIIVQCNNKHIYFTTYNSIQQGGGRCPECNRILMYERAKNEVEEIGYKLLSKEYKDVRTKMTFECDRHHIYSTTLQIFRKDCRCPICHPIGNVGFSHKYVKEFIEKVDEHKLLSQYEKAHLKLKIKCKRGHIFWMSFLRFRDGHRCPVRCSEIEMIKSKL